MKPGDFLASLTSAERKEVAVARGLFAYFPDALALVARHSVRSNEKHNPGQLVHWSRDKSSDHEDCIARHSLAVAVDPDSLDGDAPHIVCRAWRALAALQVWAERERDAAPQKPVTVEEPTCCGFCEYDESDGSLVKQCPHCETKDKIVRTATAPEAVEQTQVCGNCRYLSTNSNHEPCHSCSHLNHNGDASDNWQPKNAPTPAPSDNGG